MLQLLPSRFLFSANGGTAAYNFGQLYTSPLQPLAKANCKSITILNSYTSNYKHQVDNKFTN